MDQLFHQKVEILDKESDSRCQEHERNDAYLAYIWTQKSDQPIAIDVSGCCQWHIHHFIYFKLWDELEHSFNSGAIKKILLIKENEQ